jgi:hypothetical protein
MGVAWGFFHGKIGHSSKEETQMIKMPNTTAALFNEVPAMLAHDFLSSATADGHSRRGRDKIMARTRKVHRAVADVVRGTRPAEAIAELRRLTADGHISKRDPERAREAIRDLEEWYELKRRVSQIIGLDVDSADRDGLDHALRERHAELAHLVPDGSLYDVSKWWLREFRESYVTDQEPIVRRTAKIMTSKPKEILAIVELIGRGDLVRAHLMEAKIEQREGRKRSSGGHSR